MDVFQERIKQFIQDTARQALLQRLPRWWTDKFTDLPPTTS